MVNVKDIIKQEPKLTAWVEYQNGVAFQVNYINRQALLGISRKSTALVYDKDLKARVPRLDPDRTLKEFLAVGVSGWRGVTPRTLAGIILIDMEKVPEVERDTEIPFSQESLFAVVHDAYELDTMLQNAATDLRTFNPDKEAEEKNSVTSQSGS
jgi:hypothetical protein